ncbi:hypothetical protein [Ornithinimicrobium cerasi]|uniref:Uncharacterized protein n=1 Tax=Ornithinimicrobium cerasi TaxID=2248773 RepID=A0A285VB23_9MICO|nr:hypothetical protein [Ornithinimicrobium cerasi]SOC51203.1 hypothetical protein SAMN05421879_10176 [Ornithinimicrobium cerasi]
MRETLEWATPVLYLRGKEARIFMISAHGAADATQTATAGQRLAQARLALDRADAEAAIPVLDTVLVEDPTDIQASRLRRAAVQDVKAEHHSQRPQIELILAEIMAEMAKRKEQMSLDNERILNEVMDRRSERNKQMSLDNERILNEVMERRSERNKQMSLESERILKERTGERDGQGDGTG